MKVVANFENGKMVTVERFEADQKVGTRRLYINDYIGALMSELPIQDVIHNVISREKEYATFLEELEENDMFSDFLVQTLEYANSFRIERNENFQAFLACAFKKVNLLTLNPREIERLFTALIYNVKELPKESVYVELLDQLLKKVIDKDMKQEVVSKIFPALVSMARQVESPLLQVWFELALPHIDPLWLMKAIGQLGEENEMKIAEMEIPKNCVMASTTTRRQVYVLEIPKARFRVKFHDLAYDDVGHPRMLCILHVQNERLINMKLVAVHDDTEINKTTPVYHYPYSNVFDNGTVCWNGYKNEVIKCGKDLSMIPQIFLSGTNNTHLRNDVRVLFEAYRGKDFPSEQLRPFGQTLSDLMY